MLLRTDLITEDKEKISRQGEILENKTECFGEVKSECIFRKSENGETQKYYTLSFSRIDRILETKDLEKAIFDSLNELLPKKFKSILVAGLGNADITPDAIGPFTANKIFATRHLESNFKSTFGLEALKEISVIIPGVIGKTGIEAADTIINTAKRIKPDAIIVIDALAARNSNRLFSTIQLTDTGISPGSGVNNGRKEISPQTVDMPVVAIGIPTVTDANMQTNQSKSMMVTPKDVDLLIQKSSEILSRTLNKFLQPDIDQEIISALA